MYIYIYIYIHIRLIGLLLAKFFEELPRERLSRLVVPSEAGVVDGLVVVAPVLHKLARQFDRIPLHAVNTGGGGPLHLKKIKKK